MDMYPVQTFTSKGNSLHSLCQEVGNPRMGLSSDTIMVKVQQKFLMWTHMKGFAGIHYDDVSLESIVEHRGEVMYD